MHALYRGLYYTMQIRNGTFRDLLFGHFSSDPDDLGLIGTGATRSFQRCVTRPDPTRISIWDSGGVRMIRQNIFTLSFRNFWFGFSDRPRVFLQLISSRNRPSPKEKMLWTKNGRRPDLADFRTGSWIRYGSGDVFMNRNPHFRVVLNPKSHPATG
jgi:hypothetical protein